MVADLRSGPLTVLIGSGVSQFSSPGCSTGLPSGAELSKQLARLLSADVGPTGTYVASLIEKAAFEHIMEACPYSEELRGMLARRFASGAVNDLHVAIARLLEGRRVRHVITTNYDLCLDAALAGIVKQTVITEHHVQTLDFGQPIYFKIHGCASQPASLVFTLSAERRMDSWKRFLLERLLTGRLLIIGYSGRDFEICPEIVALGCSVIWNCFNPPNVPDLQPSACAIRILRKSGNTAVTGDMTVLISDLAKDLLVDPPRVCPDRGLAVPDDEFLSGTSEAAKRRHLDRWRCELFRGVGCARAARIAAERLLRSASSDNERSEALHYLGLALFHGGRYRQASEAYLQAADKTAEEEQQYRRRFDAVEALRCGGFTKRATSLLLELQRQCTDDRFLPPLLVRRLLLLTERVEFQRTIFRRAAVARLTKEGAGLADQLEEVATRYGCQVELAQCDQLRRRLQLRPPDRSSRAHDTFLSAVDRFHQLGYVVGKASSIRRELVDGSCQVSRAQIAEMPALLRGIGATAEMWKFGLIALAIGIVPWHHRLQLLGEITANHLACEYTLKHRAALVGHHVRESLQARLSRNSARPSNRR